MHWAIIRQRAAYFDGWAGYEQSRPQRKKSFLPLLFGLRACAIPGSHGTRNYCRIKQRKTPSLLILISFRGPQCTARTSSLHPHYILVDILFRSPSSKGSFRALSGNLCIGTIHGLFLAAKILKPRLGKTRTLPIPSSSSLPYQKTTMETQFLQHGQ